MLESKEDRKCNCGCNDNMQVAEASEMCNKTCPRDCKREEMMMQIRELDFAIIE